MLKLGRHLNQKKEALFFVCARYICAIVYLGMSTVSLGSEKVLFQMKERITFIPSHLCPHWPNTVITCRSSPHPTFLLTFQLDVFSSSSSFHLLITLCTQLTRIKEQLQSRRRKLELKGFSLFLPLPLFSFLNKFSSNSRVQRGATSARARPAASSPFLFTLSA